VWGIAVGPKGSRKVFIPLVSKSGSMLSQHGLESAVESLNYSIALWMVRSGVQLRYPEQAADVKH